MKLSIKISPQIFDFPNMHNEKLLLEKRVSEITEKYEFITKLTEWTIEFVIVLGKNNCAGIYKKGTTTPSLSIRNHSIFLPIPSNKEITWGINENKFAHRPPLDINKFKILDINCNKYDNMKDYIIEGSYLAIMDLLKSGIKLKDVAIKI